MRLYPHLWAILVVVIAACHARAEVPETIAIPAGAFLEGSDAAEREAAYRLDEAAYGHSITRKNGWYDDEAPKRHIELPAYRITRTLITNDQYAGFVAETGHRAPDVDPKTWAGYRLIHLWKRTRRHAWRDRKPPKGRGDHPVVLVSHDDARAYAKWLSEKTGREWRLPTEQEWVKAARGADGWRFPWGNKFDPTRLNSHDQGSFDTTPVTKFETGKSPFGLLDPAGQVFEWTVTGAGSGRFIVKGGSWDDKGCGICRPAARHSRPAPLKHILIGFRLVTDASR